MSFRALRISLSFPLEALWRRNSCNGCARPSQRDRRSQADGHRVKGTGSVSGVGNKLESLPLQYMFLCFGLHLS